MKRFLAPLAIIAVWACSSQHPTTAAEGVEAAAATPAPSPVVTPGAAIASPASQSPKATPNSPTEVIQRYTEELRGIVEPDKRSTKGTRDVQREQKIAEKVREFFDFNGLAKLSLGPTWNKITKAQQKEFTTVFVDLVETSYLQRSRNIMGNYKINFGKEEIKKSKARVKCSVVRTDANVDITYELHRNPQNWMIYNIILDDVDLVKNYQSQFNRIIQVHTFNGLMKRMKQKQKEGSPEGSL